MNKIRDGQTLKELKSNDTADQLVGEVFKENYQIHNNFVSHLLNLTNKMVGITREEFCRTVPKICDQSYEPPMELKSFLIGGDKENNLKAAQIMINMQPKNSTYFYTKSLYRSRAGSNFYGTEYEIWTDFGPVGNTENKIGADYEQLL